MDQSFLEKLAQHITDNHAGLGNHLCVVLPNRRAGLFLKRHLIPQGDVPVWAPAIFSMEDFISRLSGLTVADPLELMIALYEAHLEKEGSRAAGFDSFIGWAGGLVSDFEDADQYLINPGRLFGYLSEARALEHWNVDHSELTDFEKRYLDFYNSLADYYRHYTKRLLQKKTSYHGLACRTIAENPEQYCSTAGWNHIIFAGFNALTPAQQVIINHFLEEKKATILWDADAYYMNNEHQEAGMFLRKYKAEEKLGGFGELTDYYRNAGRNIVMAGVPRKVGQVNFAGSILKKLAEESEKEVLSKTAIVLADESLLLPLLNAIPPEIREFNVTMGFPMQQSPVYNLFDSIFEMHVNATEGREAGGLLFYHRHLLAVLQHGYLRFFADGDALDEIIRGIIKANRPFIGVQDLLKAGNEESRLMQLLQIIMKKPESTHSFTGQLIEIVTALKSGTAKAGDAAPGLNKAENEILYSISLILNRLHDFTRKSGYIGELKTLHAFFKEAAAASPVAFYGEPLQGVQVMGMLETRALDFENIILLSANEGTLPSGKSYNSFIPFDIRKEFGLPTHQEHQAIYAYHFYRLLQRCSNAWLIYNTEAESLGGGEKSRFLNQIIHELPAYNEQNQISEISPAFNMFSGTPAPIEVRKDEAILSKLREKAKNGFSSTALTRYISCSLKYYLADILKIDETEEVSENIDFRTLGTVVHSVLQQFYGPFIHSFPLKHDFEAMKAKTEAALAVEFEKEFPGTDTQKGYNLLISKVANTWIEGFLNQEADAGYNPEKGDHLIALETDLSATLEITGTDNAPSTVKLMGYADRIDRVNGRTRIIDYKTGKVEERDLKVTDPGELFLQQKTTNDKVFQLMFYLLLSEHESFATGLPDSGIISFRNLQKGFLPLKFVKIEATEAMEAFRDGVKRLVEEILNPDIPFTQTPFKEQCAYCPFQAICNRFEKKGW